MRHTIKMRRGKEKTSIEQIVNVKKVNPWLEGKEWVLENLLRADTVGRNHTSRRRKSGSEGSEYTRGRARKTPRGTK